MSKKSLLLKVEDTLKLGYYVEPREPNALEIATDPESLPFAFIVIEDRYPDILLLSLRVGFDDPIVVADISLVLSSISKVEIVDEFYIDEVGSEILWGTQAHKKSFEMDNKEFLKLSPINDLKH